MKKTKEPIPLKLVVDDEYFPMPLRELTMLLILQAAGTQRHFYALANIIYAGEVCHSIDFYKL